MNGEVHETNAAPDGGAHPTHKSKAGQHTQGTESTPTNSETQTEQHQKERNPPRSRGGYTDVPDELITATGPSIVSLEYDGRRLGGFSDVAFNLSGPRVGHTSVLLEIRG